MSKRRTAPSWTDLAGKSYSPGDIVAISVINGRSPQTVIARVEEIFLDDSKGQPYEDGDYDYQTDTRRTWPSCSVQATPLIDARGFHRYSERKVGYTIPSNILKLDITEQQLQQIAEQRERDREATREPFPR